MPSPTPLPPMLQQNIFDGFVLLLAGAIAYFIYTEFKNTDVLYVAPRPGQRTRIPILSLIVDRVYGAIPAPFFVDGDRQKGELSPDKLMKDVPGFLLVALSVSLGVGAPAGLYLANFGDWRLSVAVFIPIAVHWTLFVGHALPNSSEKLFDLAGQIGMSLMVIFAGYNYDIFNDPRKVLVFVASLLWSFRLGYFLFTRMLERKEDFRFLKAKHSPGFHFFTWNSQGVWCLLQGLSIMSLFQYSATQTAPMGLQEVLGIAVWAYGLFTESLADMQKLRFVRRYNGFEGLRPFIREGIWNYSRHPNFAGESMCWIGMFIVCSAGLPSWRVEAERWRLLLALVAPIWSFVFLQQTTVPWLEVLADRKYGDDPEYLEYKARTSEYWILPHRPRWI